MNCSRKGRSDKEKPGLYANIRAKRARIQAGSGEKMRKPGSEAAPSAQDFKEAAKTAVKDQEGVMGKSCDCGKKKGACSCEKADMKMKSPYADGSGYNRKDVGAAFDGAMYGKPLKMDAPLKTKSMMEMGLEEEEGEEEERDDKKCGASAIADNKTCRVGQGKATAKKSGNTLLNIAKGAALAGGAAAAGVALANAAKGKGEQQAPSKEGKPGVGGQFRAPSVPKRKVSSVAKRLAEIKRKNEENPGRPELRDLRAIGRKAERRVARGEKPMKAAGSAMKPRLKKRG